jgi:sulfonate transport system substrate-binding protein
MLRTTVLAALSLPFAAVADGSKPPVIRIGVSSAGVGNPPRTAAGWTSIAQVHHYVENEFAADGVPVKWIFFKGQGPAVNEAMANDQLDFTTLGDLPSIIGRASGLHTRLVMVTSARSESFIAVAPDSPIKSVADLRGKKITLNKGTASQLLANRVFEKYGLAEKDVKIVNMEPANGKAAFLAGQVDAFFGTVDVLLLKEKGQARILWSSKDFPAACSAGHVLVNENFAKRFPDASYRVVKALVKAAHWASAEANRDSVFRIWGSAGAIPESTYRQAYQGIPLSARLNPCFDSYVTGIDARSVADAKRFRLIRRDFDALAWIDRSYVDRAVKELGLQGFWTRFDENGDAVKGVN